MAHAAPWPNSPTANVARVAAPTGLTGIGGGRNISGLRVTVPVTRGPFITPRIGGAPRSVTKMTKPKTQTPDDTVPATNPEPAKPIAAPAEDTPPATEGGEKTATISTRQEDFEIVYADWAGTTPDQVAGLRLMNGSYENPKVAHCWHFYQLGSGGLE